VFGLRGVEPAEGSGFSVFSVRKAEGIQLFMRG
jgi:hypothetical protein